jgi:multidrug efflux pump subunit AcrA (membrane-fusion protein)
MNSPAQSRAIKNSLRWLACLALVTAAVAAIALADRWLPQTRQGLARWLDPAAYSKVLDEHAHNDHAEHHDHDHAGHEEANSIKLSDQARKNIGLTLLEIRLQDFQRTITVPAMVVERPGRSTLEVTAPLTGVVTRIYPIEGEAVEPGQPLFDLQLTHEELVQSQSEFLKIAEELDVIGREVERLEKITQNGAVAGKALLERQYEQQKQQAALRAQGQALRLHGLSEEQVQSILKDRSLLKTLTVRAPLDEEHASSSGAARLLQIHELHVEQGQHVDAGKTLCTLVNHAELYLEGTAFQQDADEINQAAARRWNVTAVLESRSAQPELISNLEILYVAGKVDVESRALHFYVKLPNELLRQSETEEHRKFVYWRFKPGQRMQLRVPVDTWQERIVLPVGAVAEDGVEAYVFQPNGDHFDRRPVHVEYRDQIWAVIANDGSLYPGDTVAQSGAQQLQLALKNKSGGAIDPHAGHNH